MTYLPDTIETPCVVVDLAVAEKNILRAQAHFDKHGIKTRPHIKTHKLPLLAHKQIEAGAIGVTCQKLGEAEVMAAAGIEDILVTYNIMGAGKFSRLLTLADQCRISVVADSDATVKGLSDCFADSGKTLNVLVECDTGQKRCGVQSPEAALDLARVIDAAPGLAFAGLMTYPGKKDHENVDGFLQRTSQLCRGSGLEVAHVSNGGTPDMLNAQAVTSATEHRSGTYIYNDRSLVESGDCGWDDCALQVAVTVVSRPTEDRAIIDAGSKALTSDTMGLDGFGYVTGYPTAIVRELHEEHGILDLSSVSGLRPLIGDILHIIPNHACPVSNLYDRIFLKKPDLTIEPVQVAARGQVW